MKEMKWMFALAFPVAGCGAAKVVHDILSGEGYLHPFWLFGLPTVLAVLGMFGCYRVLTCWKEQK